MNDDKSTLDILLENPHFCLGKEDTIIIDPDNGSATIIPCKKDRSIVRTLYAALLIIEETSIILGEEAPIFLDRCNSFYNIAEMIAYNYDKLSYQERAMVSQRLGFDMNTFLPKPKMMYTDIATDHEYSAANTASRRIKNALKKIAEEIIFNAEEADYVTKLQRTTR